MRYLRAAQFHSLSFFLLLIMEPTPEITDDAAPGQQTVHANHVRDDIDAATSRDFAHTPNDGIKTNHEMNDATRRLLESTLNGPDGEISPSGV